jgi:flagellar motor switch protein FliN/FliY
MADELDGMLSQDDIDAALAAAGMSGGEGASESAPPEPAEGGAPRQADIDAEPAGASDEAVPVAGGELTQADIDAALNGEATSPAEESRVDATGRPFDEVAAAMAAAIEAEGPAAEEGQMPGISAPPPPGSQPVEMPELQRSAANDGPEVQGIDLLRDVDLNVKIELGRCRMLVDDVLRLGDGAVVELDKLAGDPVDVYVNDRLVARGEVLVLNDNFCVRISDILSRDLEAVRS